MPGRETILVVDDELVVLSLTQAMLERNGYSVLLAQGGRQALNLLQKWAELHIDLAIIDIVMPDLTGFEVAAEIRKLHPNFPVLFVSAYSEVPELRPVFTREIPYLAKPFTSVTLIRKIREMFDAGKISSAGEIS